jgi:hypothetical protein
MLNCSTTRPKRTALGWVWVRLPPQCHGGTESGEDESRIETCGGTDNRDQERYPCDQFGIPPIFKAQRGVHKGSEGGEKQLHQRQSERHGETDRKKGFAEKLQNKIVPARPGRLADADLDGALRRPRRHQIGEIDRGDKNDQNRDGGDGVKRVAVS